MVKFWRRTRPEPPALRKDRPTEATLARIRAEKALEATRAETPFYEALGKRLRRAQERNGITEGFEKTFRGRHA